MALQGVGEGIARGLSLAPAALTYAYRNVLARKASTTVTTLGVAISVTVFVVMAATAAGIGRVAVSTGSPLNLMVLSDGATSAEVSYLDVQTLQRARLLPGIARDERGDALASVEYLLVRTFRRDPEGRGDEDPLVTVRGVTPRAFDVHEGVRLESGRFPTETGEILVGSILARKQGFRLGDEVWLGSQRSVITGLIDASGQIFAGEIWANIDDLRSRVSRNGASTLVVRAASLEGVDSLEQELSTAPGLAVNAKREPSYYGEIQKVTAPVAALGNFIAVILGFGAVLAGMNTLYAAMSRRTRELGTLRALGFGRWFVGGTLLLESILVAGIGGVVGGGMALLFDGFALNLLGVAFELRVDSEMLSQGGFLALLVGLGGGVFPAAGALRLEIIQALRQA